METLIAGRPGSVRGDPTVCVNAIGRENANVMSTILTKRSPNLFTAGNLASAVKIGRKYNLISHDGGGGHSGKMWLDNIKFCKYLTLRLIERAQTELTA